MPARTNVIFRALDEGGVLVHLDGHHIFELNATAAHVWPLLVAGAARDTLVASLVTHFDVDTETAATAVDQLVADLAAHGLFQP